IFLLKSIQEGHITKTLHIIDIIQQILFIQLDIWVDIPMGLRGKKTIIPCLEYGILYCFSFFSCSRRFDATCHMLLFSQHYLPRKEKGGKPKFKMNEPISKKYNNLVYNAQH
ncbi:hypothetical protein ACJX0J_032545, partial [Zea mays]